MTGICNASRDGRRPTREPSSSLSLFPAVFNLLYASLVTSQGGLTLIEQFVLFLLLLFRFLLFLLWLGLFYSGTETKLLCLLSLRVGGRRYFFSFSLSLSYCRSCCYFSSPVSRTHMHPSTPPSSCLRLSPFSSSSTPYLFGRKRRWLDRFSSHLFSSLRRLF